MAKIDRHVSVIKSLVGDQLNPKQLQELLGLSNIDLIAEHGLTDVEAQKVLTHAKQEMYRMRAQGYSFGTVDDDQRSVGYPVPPTRTSPISEAKLKTKLTKPRGLDRKTDKAALLRKTIRKILLEEFLKG